MMMCPAPGPDRCIGSECGHWPCLPEEPPSWFDDFETEHCQFCPDDEVCVLVPEEIEDKCPQLHKCSEKETTE